jgi:cell division septal protein FtsQ
MMRRRSPSSGRARKPRHIPAVRRRSGNPYFNKPKYGGRVEGPSPKMLALIIFPLFGLAVFGYLIWGPSFKIKEVKIEGASAETEKSIQNILKEQMNEKRLFPADNVFFLDKEDIAVRIGKTFFLEGLDVKKKLPGTIEMTVREKTVRGTLLADGRFLGLDGAGFIVRELTAKEVSSLGPLPPEYGQALAPELGAETVYISDAEVQKETQEEPVEPKRFKSRYPLISLDYEPEDPNGVRVGGQPIPMPAMSLIIQAFSRLKEVIGEPAIRFTSRGPDTDSVEAIMETGWKAYFGADQPFDIQANKLALILKDRVGDRRSELEYVDLRYGERIFFKFKSPEPTTE